MLWQQIKHLSEYIVEPKRRMGGNCPTYPLSRQIGEDAVWVTLAPADRIDYRQISSPCEAKERKEQ